MGNVDRCRFARMRTTISINHHGNVQRGKERKTLLEDVLEFDLRLWSLWSLTWELTIGVLMVIKLYWFESPRRLSLNNYCLTLP